MNKTHELDVLLDLCCQCEPSFQALDNLADVLTPYATEFRYPGDLMEPEKEDAEEAIKMAIQIYDFIVSRIENKEK
ncbi:HEPN domain-containing protein [Synechocystis salina]|uniref:HEPN domain-containing protein n=1 Tax=Synechocystis salina TaxID=945780 RepID=UPI001D1405AE|nr:HEPN domain-containing protein [Synechocystis salina]